MRTLPLLILLAFSAAASAQTIATAPIGPIAPPPPPEWSTLVVPIHASLAPLLPQLESQVPKSIAKTDTWELDPEKQFGMKYRVTRDPIALTVIGSGIHATTTVHFALQGCRRTKKPFTDEVVMWPCLSCGFGEPLRDAWISLVSHLEWDTNWRLHSHTRAMPVDYSSHRCQVTFANLDITDWKIAPIVNDQLHRTLETIDANTPRLANVRPAAGQVWASLQTPVAIAPRTWLVMEPAEVSLGPITGSGLIVTSTMTLRARTRVIVGERPPVTPRPLPPLHAGTPIAGAIRIPFNVELSYGEASRLMTENFGRRKYEGVAIDSMRIAPAANGRVSIELNVDYRASRLRHYRGPVYLEARPAFDASARMVSLEDLQYTLDARHKNLFVRIADRLAHESLRTQLAQTARWSVAPQIESIRGAIAGAVTRSLAAGVAMRGRVDAVALNGMTIDTTGIIIHALATGSAEVDISTFH